MGKLSVLHISDIHIGNTYYKDPKDIAIRIIEALETHNKEKIGCVVVSGDIFDGKAHDFDKRREHALEFLNYLKDELELEPSDFVITPGNHDLNRRDASADFSEYKTLLKDFYGERYYDQNINDKYLFNVKVYEEKKIAFIALNSCMVEACRLSDEDIKWIDNIALDEQSKEVIKKALSSEKEKEWDDYGLINKLQLRDAFKSLEQQLVELSNYTIVACFHHHFYPFPEIYKKVGDRSIIRNFTDVIEKFQNKNVKIVLHGHKHMPIVRPVTNQKYLSNPDSIFYVLSAGSIGKNDVENHSFQQLDIYSPDQDRVADVCRFNFKLEELQTPDKFSIPPKKNYDQNTSVELTDLFKEEFLEEYESYMKDVYESDSISLTSQIDQIVTNISQTITQFKSLRDILKFDPANIQLLLYTIHYRINYLHSKSSQVEPRFLEKMKNILSGIINNEKYTSLIIQLLRYDNNREFEKRHDELLVKHEDCKKYTSLITVALFFTDLYLTFMKYGEVYFNKEKLAHSINIKLDPETFHQSIPLSTIKIESDTDRRLATIHFKCKNPTVHKVAVLIVKDFEKRISKIEDSFKCLGLKIYYLVPKVEKEKGKYDLENLNFEAYIPTLLPLLTGENLYKKREVFIRELIQNSFDAILLREKILKKDGGGLAADEKIIDIEIGLEQDSNSGNSRKYLRITDQGIGMDSFKIERYFTSIGRSFYQSEEFEELQKNKSIQYRPVSNFGIGFLSAFMVSGEITVVTRSYDCDYALEIHIPNYEGCFFIKRIESQTIKIGTTITLYEDHRKNLNENKIIDYIKDVFSDFQLNIRVNDKLKHNVSNIDSFAIRRSGSVNLFSPIVDDKTVNISWLKEIKTGKFIDKYPYGILLKFDLKAQKQKRNRHNQYLNSGILLSNTNVNNLNFEETSNSNCFYNLPSSFISLDVAREKILAFKSKSIKKENVLINLADQGLEVIGDMEESCAMYPIKIINDIALFFNINNVSEAIRDKYDQQIFNFDFNTPYSISLKKNVYGKFDLDNDSQGIFNMINIYFTLMKNCASKSKELLKYIDCVLNIVEKTFKDKTLLDKFIVNESGIVKNQSDASLLDNLFMQVTKKNIFDDMNIDYRIRRLLDRNKGLSTHEDLLINDDLLMKFYNPVDLNLFLLNVASSSEAVFAVRDGGSAINRGKNNKFYNILESLVYVDFVQNFKRRKPNHLSIYGISAVFKIFYVLVSEEVTIADANKFLIKIK